MHPKTRQTTKGMKSVFFVPAAVAQTIREITPNISDPKIFFLDFNFSKI